jgi:hypothetical protein
MSRRKKVYGKCKLCGFEGKLSYEHVPPSSAYNNSDYYYSKLSELMEVELDDDLNYPEEFRRKRIKKGQGGFGYYSLCERCNNNTGSWYGWDYILWVYQSMGILLKANHRPTLYYPTQFYPLRVIKQVLCMFFSINHLGFNDSEPELVSFILNRERRYLNPKYKIFCYYNIDGESRYLPTTVLGNFKTHVNITLSEFTFPPFGFVLTLNSPSPDSRLADISHFSNYGYDEQNQYFQSFKVLPTYIGYIPGDYRTKKQIINEAHQAKKLKK